MCPKIISTCTQYKAVINEIGYTHFFIAHFQNPAQTSHILSAQQPHVANSYHTGQLSLTDLTVFSFSLSGHGFLQRLVQSMNSS